MNIAPTKIDLRLMEHPKLTEDAVASGPDTALGERVCACAVLAQKKTISLKDITSFLEKKHGSLQMTGTDYHAQQSAAQCHADNRTAQIEPDYRGHRLQDQSRARGKS